jgi:hypothetical protein
MAKYRLKIETDGNRTIFSIEKKVLLWWEHYTYLYKPNSFYTREEALERLKEINNKPRITYEYPEQ